MHGKSAGRSAHAGLLHSTSARQDGHAATHLGEEGELDVALRDLKHNALMAELGDDVLYAAGCQRSQQPYECEH